MRRLHYRWTNSFVILWFYCLCQVNSQRPPSTLTQGQFFPTKGSNDPKISQARASGPIRDIIRPNTARFRKVLVRNVNPSIQFLREETRYMTSRAKSKLDVLASRVRTVFGSRAYIKVVAGWSGNVGPDPLLLRYEGRELQVQTTNPSLLGRLAGLAIESGFDWVYYPRGRTYITISVIPDVCQTKIDLTFVVDTSGSVGWSGFLKTRDFLKKVVDFFNIGRDQTQIALLTYSRYVTREFALNKYHDKNAMKLAIERMKFENSNTATSAALQVMQTWAFSPINGARRDKSIPKIGILITDGNSNNRVSTINAATKAKAAGISIFVIGIGSSLGIVEMNGVASDPDNTHVFRLDSFHNLNGFVDQLSTVSCDEGATVSKCDSAETAVEAGSFKYFRGQFKAGTKKVTIQVVDKAGRSYLFTSLTNKNPGPLDPGSQKAIGPNSPRALTVNLASSANRVVFIAVQGQLDHNKFLLGIWDSLFPKDYYQATVYENDPSRRAFIRVQSTQPGYRFRYSITYGNQRNSFRINPDTGEISATQNLDRELQVKYSLVVVAADVNLVCHKGRTQVDVFIKDRNDNNPKFSLNRYMTRVREDTPLNTRIQKVVATDKDAGQNAKIRYSILPAQFSSYLRMSSSTGEIFLIKSLDYEKLKTFTVTLKAQDMGSPARSGTALFTVHVGDVNEQPYFTNKCTQQPNPQCSMQIQENLPPGKAVMKMLADDPDKSQTCRLRFSLTSSDARYFKIDQYTGQITTSVKLDRELKENYFVHVKVSDCSNLHQSTVVRVTAIDVNDNAPVFLNRQYNSEVLENKPARTNVVQVRAKDADAGKNALIIFSIKSGNVGGAFEIHPTTGSVATKISLDYETISSYVLTILATDQGNPALSSSATLRVRVRDVNDNNPTFEGTPQFRIKENAKRGTMVGVVKVKDRDQGLNGQVRCSILSGNLGFAFVMNAGTCTLYSQGNLDREARDTYRLIVRAADLGKPSLSAQKTYTVTLLDENDNAPIFQKSFYRFTIKENTAPGSSVAKVSATDKDIGANAEIRYFVKSGDDNPPKFRIDKDSGAIYLDKALDYGTKNNYDLVVQAEDKGAIKKTGATFVRITIQDTNDYKPKFSKSTYQTRIPEDSPIGKVVLQVTASDKDSGPSGKLVFSITSGNVRSRFLINSDTGVIQTRAELNYEAIKSYKLTVKATDLGQPPQFAVATVDIEITDVNDNAPKLSQNPTVFKLLESASTGHLIGTLKATDADSGINAQVSFSMAVLNTHIKVESDGRLILQKQVDYESVREYNLVVTVVDHGKPQLQGTGNVIVKILDVNDNPPKFSTPVCEILENSRRGSHVCYITASDADSGLNGKVEYTIKSSTPLPFIINKATGQLTVTGALDREVISKYQATVTGNDLGNPRLSTELSVNIIVKDENDNVPVFKKSTFAFKVIEESSSALEIGTTEADDKDVGRNAELVYMIIRGNDATRFTIDAGSGKITANPSLDRETTESYHLIVRVQDKGKPSQSAEVNVDITVLDINDNSPIFNRVVYGSKIREDAAIGSKVVQVEATDADIGKNGEIIYSITGGKNSDAFEIDGKSGVVTTKIGLDYETIPSYAITVTAADQGTPGRSQTVQVNIKLINVDDNAPEFGKINEVQVSEGVNVGFSVVKFNAVDKDGGTLTYKITGGNAEGSFALDSKKGELRVAKRLDREKTDSYNISVTVTDASSHATVGYLPIKILDINDNSPIFDKSSYQAEVTENGLKGIDVIKVSATDKDIGINKEIEYRIESGNKNGDFVMNSSTGQLKTTRSLDRELISAYALVVKAIDKGSPALSSLVKVRVTVKDLNDNQPKFEKSSYTLSVAENSKVGTTLLVAKATDPDEGKNGLVSYSIVSEDGKAVTSFAIDQSRGLITTTKILDRETKASYKLVVSASDGGSPPKRSTADVLVTVEDENDNSPVITSPDKIPPLKENVIITTTVAQIKATDADTGKNAQLSFLLVAGNVKNSFRLDPLSGVLKTRSSLDREDISSYKLEIKVVDRGAPQLHTVKQYVVDLIDINDNCPRFTLNRFRGSVEENVKVGTEVLQLKAIDADIGANANLRYSISKSIHSDDFSCDPKTGKITVAKSLDYETIKQYIMNCEVTDGKCKKTVPCKIDVGNVNDNSPIFEKAFYTAHVRESAPVNQLVINVKATDKDSFGQIIYEIVPKSNEFSIGARGGVIKTLVSLDRETKDKYILLVKATDNGQPGRSSTVNVTVIVDDVNDNRPVFLNDTGQVTVQENRKAGEFVITIKATDEDSGVNKEILYEIVQSKVSVPFAVNKESGTVTTTASFDREKESIYTVQLVAKDKGKPQQTSEPFTLTVKVGDENDNKPFFVKQPNISVSEGDPVGTNVPGVFAEDRDIGQNAEIVYSITKGNEENTFSIGKSSGVLTISKQLDRETKDVYFLTITAKDKGTPSLQSTANIIVRVTDINDNYPVFNARSLTQRIKENQKKGTVVGTVSATDKDLGVNSEISYSINTNDKFEIDAKTGVVTTMQALDREEKEVYKLKVGATDHGMPSLLTNETLTITVDDEDDNCPIFKPKVYNITVKEDINVGSVLLVVTATDLDIGVNAKLRYGIKESNDKGAIYVNSSSGALLVRQPLDREYTDLYHVRLRAGNPNCGAVLKNETETGEGNVVEGNATFADVYIQLLDVNDNPPRFAAKDYTYYFDNSSIVHLMNITAVDDDTGMGKVVKFRKLDEKAFENSKANGRHVTVEAYDLGTPSLAANTTVTVINRVVCDAMAFSLSEGGALSVVTLCGFVIQPTAKTVELNHEVTLECQTRGNTPAKYHWLQDGKVVSPSSTSGNFKIKNAQHHNEGLYSCVSSNDAGNIQSQAVFVDVYEKPRILEQPEDISVAIGESAVMSVKASADPEPEYQWYKSNQQVDWGKGFKTNTLTLPPAISQDEGEYYCEIKNAFGKVKTRNLKLNIFDREAVVKLDIRVKKPNEKRNCNYFNKAEFEKKLGKILGNKVSVTHLKKSHICNVTACSPNPCKNKGKCQLVKDGFVCLCQIHWTGKTCEKDKNECALEPPICQDKNICTNTNGSYKCNCPKGKTGRNCELDANGCSKNGCSAKERCVPSNNELPKRYACVPKGQEFEVVLKVGKGGMDKYKIQEMLNLYLKNMNVKQSRRRRSTATDDLTQCDAHVIQDAPGVNGTISVRFVIICSGDLQNKVPDNYLHFCNGILTTEEIAKSCNMQGMPIATAAPQMKAEASKIEVGVVVIKGNTALPAEETNNLLEDKDAKSKLVGSGIVLDGFEKSYEEKKKEKSSNVIGIVVGICIAALFVGAIVAAVIFLRRKKEDKKSEADMITNRLDRRQSKEDLLRGEISLTAVDSPGIQNKGFSSDASRDSCAPAVESFMFNMPEKVNKKSTGYDTLPWYRGVLSKAEADNYFDKCRQPGSYILYKTEGEKIILAVKGPDEASKIFHVPVARPSTGGFSVTVGSMDPVSGETIEKVVDHFKKTPMKFDDTPEFALKGPWQKSTL